MKIKVTRPDGSIVWDAVLMDGLLPNLSMFGIGTDGQLTILPTVPPDHAIYPPWKLEIVPGSGEEVQGEEN